MPPFLALKGLLSRLLPDRNEMRHRQSRPPAPAARAVWICIDKGQQIKVGFAVR